ncbi:U-box domain-containing protein 14-like [Senna tora]|uniref:U-box domain-containing protein 14-like n=1 Tax=Senna tora TaxID=362788 RepID=A0A834WQQ8_9FABA|nr:U-box domain-containing protein 14-like [Senna tora]
MSSTQAVETMKECLSVIEVDSPEVQEKALQTLASLTRVSPQNRSFVAQTEGAIPTLASLTNAASPIIQTLSLLILFNLSLNPDLKHSLADMQTIDYLNSHITSPSSPDSSKLASSLICSLAMLDKNKAKLGVSGTVELLVKAITISLSTSPHTDSHHLLSCLAELVHFHGNSTLAVRAGAVPVLLQVVETSDSEDVAATSLAVLGSVVRFNEGLSALKNSEKVVNCMSQVLRRRSLLCKEGAAEILLRLFDESEECVKEALMLPDFSTLLADLSVRGSVRVREKADLLMKMITHFNLALEGKGTTFFV